MNAAIAADPKFRELAAGFVRELPARTGRLRGAANAWNRGDARDLAHQLKGAGGGYGFDSVSELAAAVETLCVEETPQADLLRAVERLSQECDRLAEEWA
ncbi:MAG: Hpt domain-containing protein [Planctomycetota bacterium]